MIEVFERHRFGADKLSVKSGAKRLTKSRFKVGTECPTKLWYLDRADYGNKKQEDAFLQALAEGGFQVGELAKLYYPGGHEIKSLDYEESLQQTAELLKHEDVIIYEAALGFENLFVRVDILKKRGSFIELIEVKAKSFNFEEDFKPFDQRAQKKGIYRLKKDFAPYLYDLSFQTYVAQQTLIGFKILPKLALVDTSKKATIDKLHQLFLLKRDGDRARVEVKAPPLDLGTPLLSELHLRNEVDLILTKAELPWASTFEGLIENFSKQMKSPLPIQASVGAQCKHCEFRISEKMKLKGKKSGFDECWMRAKNLKPEDFSKPFVFDVWDFKDSSKVIEQGKVFAAELTPEDLKLHDQSKNGGNKANNNNVSNLLLSPLNRNERQWLQVEAARSSKKPITVRQESLKQDLLSFEPPFHFIDFETNMVAIPFHRGRRPYEQMAFQFSHHVLEADGKFRHQTEFIFDEPGVFPNFHFVRALKSALEPTTGTVFRFAAHENTVLNQIRAQLRPSSEPDREELIQWIESLASPPKERAGEWVAKRMFVDMREVILRSIYWPSTNGSNSIKQVLPAVLNSSPQEVLHQFGDWIKQGPDGQIEDPYKILPPLFADFDPEEVAKIEERLLSQSELNNGGAAMMAWARMQFTEMSQTERLALRNALLRYCELDTFAMVMIFKWWQWAVDAESLKTLQAA